MIVAFFIVFSCTSQVDLSAQAEAPTSAIISAKPNKLTDATSTMAEEEVVERLMAGYSEWFDENGDRILSEVYSANHCDPFFDDCQN
jgi:hypothetical protein